MLKTSLLNCLFKTKNILYKIRVRIPFRFCFKNIKPKINKWVRNKSPSPANPKP